MVEETAERPAPAADVAQAAGIIALGNIASRVLGLVREMVKSGLFGAGPHVDALNAALRLPTTMYDLLVGGMVNSALIPVLSDYTAPERRAELWYLLGILTNIILLLTTSIVLLGELLAPFLVRLLIEGLSAAYRQLAVELLRLALPAVILLSLSSVLSGGLYALKRFTFPAFTAAIFNGGVVLMALLLGRRLDVHSMIIGLLVGAALQVLFQLPGFRDARMHCVIDFRHPALRRIVALYAPILTGLVVDTLAVLLSYNLASRVGEGSISWMEYAATIIQFPLGLIVTAVSLAILPTLSRQAGADKGGPFLATLAQGLRLVLTLIIPAALGLYVLAHPLVALIFEHGDFTPADTVATAGALRCALPGLLFAAVDQPLIFAFYARKDTLTPALVGVGTTIFYAVLALTAWWSGMLTLPLLVLINSGKLAAHALAMLYLTRRRLGRLRQHGLWRLVAKSTPAAALMAGVTWGAMDLLSAAFPAGPVWAAAAVCGAGGVGLLVYGGLAWYLDIEEIHLLRDLARDGYRRLTGDRRQFIMSHGERVMTTSEQRPARTKRRPPVHPERYDEDYFLGACEGYAEFIASEGAHLSRRLRQAFAVAEISPGMQVLDVGCGRGEILRHCAALGARAYGIDYAPAATRIARTLIDEENTPRVAGVYRANARRLPFPSRSFDRVLMFDLVEHLHPWELAQTLAEARRVLRLGGRLIIHTAPNVWYDRYAYPLVRLVRILMGQGERYPKDPRAIIPANLDVHVNEQSALSLWLILRRAGFRPQVWLATPPQHRREGMVLRTARHILFNWPPFRWFFEREVFAVAEIA